MTNQQIKVELEKFSTSELLEFLKTNFPKVYNNLSSQMTKTTIIMVVIDYFVYNPEEKLKFINY